MLVRAHVNAADPAVVAVQIKRQRLDGVAIVVEIE
jgi:hypothetical protein